MAKYKGTPADDDEDDTEDFSQRDEKELSKAYKDDPSLEGKWVDTDTSGFESGKGGDDEESDEEGT